MHKQMHVTYDEPRRVRDINWRNYSYYRAGIIPVVHQGLSTFFGFGIDNYIGAIGDFGGHRETFDRDALDTAIRECHEESLDVFGVFTREELQDHYVLEGPNTLEILVPVLPPISKYTIEFHNKDKDSSYEVQNIVWLNTDQVLTAIDYPHINIGNVQVYRMYDKIREVLSFNKDVIANL